MAFFCSWLRKGGFTDATKTRRLNKEEIRKQLIDSLIKSEKVETEDLNKQAEILENSEDAATIIKKCDEIIRKKRKKHNFYGASSRKVFRKSKEKENFTNWLTLFHPGFLVPDSPRVGKNCCPPRHKSSLTNAVIMKFGQHIDQVNNGVLVDSLLS